MGPTTLSLEKTSNSGQAAELPPLQLHDLPVPRNCAANPVCLSQERQTGKWAKGSIWMFSQTEGMRDTAAPCGAAGKKSQLQASSWKGTLRCRCYWWVLPFSRGEPAHISLYKPSLYLGGGVPVCTCPACQRRTHSGCRPRAEAIGKSKAGGKKVVSPTPSAPPHPDQNDFPGADLTVLPRAKKKVLFFPKRMLLASIHL